VNQTTLYYREGSSDKVYQVFLETSGDQFVVNFAFGRRGSTLQTGTKTTNPVDYETASKLFTRLVKEKQAKGYTPGEDGTPYTQAEKASQVAGVQPQLLNPIEAEEAARLVGDPAWCLQEKKDGRRLLLRRRGERIDGINRKGLLVGLPASLLQSARRVGEDYLIDGECVGDRLHAFDLLSRGGTSLLAEPYLARLNQLIDLLDYSDHPHIELIETAFETAEKQSFVETFRRDQCEGVVFKRLDAPYTPGRPSRGGSQLKYKFCATASFIVARLNDQRSVLLRLVDQAGTAGNVTIPPDHPVPKVGAVVEVRYLYAFRQSGCLYQPVYLGLRDDTDPSECTADQLKYKSPDEPEAA
jgi:bifunctional non-homologous end joining protein LigD